VPAGTPIAIPLFAIQNCIHNWEAPDEFIPDRWLQVGLSYCCCHTFLWGGAPAWNGPFWWKSVWASLSCCTVHVTTKGSTLKAGILPHADWSNNLYIASKIKQTYREECSVLSMDTLYSKVKLFIPYKLLDLWSDRYLDCLLILAVWRSKKVLGQDLESRQDESSHSKAHELITISESLQGM